MKSWIALALAVLVVAFLGGERSAGTDVGRLRPVEVLWVRVEQGTVRLQTDLSDCGDGTDVEAATVDLKRKASGEVFMETAEYLLIDENARTLLPKLIPHLRPSCMVCLVQGEVDMECVGAFLRTHPPRKNLAQYQAGDRELEVLKICDGGMEFVS